MPEPIAVRPPTVASRDFFSLPSSCARFWSLQTLGSASACSTSFSLFCLPSRSKIPPQLGGPGVQVLEQGVDLVEAFGFHGANCTGVEAIY
jgi:hypothetical protein